MRSALSAEEINDKIAATVAFTAALKHPHGSTDCVSPPPIPISQGRPSVSKTNMAPAITALLPATKEKENVVQRLRNRFSNIMPRRSKTIANLGTIAQPQSQAEEPVHRKSVGGRIRTLSNLPINWQRLTVHTPSPYCEEDDPFRVSAGRPAVVDPFVEEHIMDSSLEDLLAIPPDGSSTPRPPRRPSKKGRDNPALTRGQELTRLWHRTSPSKSRRLGRSRSHRGLSRSPTELKSAPAASRSRRRNTSLSVPRTASLSSEGRSDSSSKKPTGPLPRNVDAPQTSCGEFRCRSRCPSFSTSQRSATLGHGLGQRCSWNDQLPRSRKRASPTDETASVILSSEGETCFDNSLRGNFNTGPTMLNLAQVSNFNSHHEPIEQVPSSEQGINILLHRPWPNLELPPPASCRTPRRSQTLSAIPRPFFETDELLKFKKHPSPTKQQWDAFEEQLMVLRKELGCCK